MSLGLCGGFGVCEEIWGGFRVNWEMMKLSLSWVSQSLACILTRACSRVMSLSVSMVGCGTLVGDVVSGPTEEESLARRYMEGSQGKPKVYFILAADWSLVERSFFGTHLAGDPKKKG